MLALNRKLNKKFFSYQKFVFYVNLSITPERERSGDMEHYIKRTAESLSSKTRNVQVSNLFEQKDCLSILIYGAPGSGKSTVTQKIASSWASREMWDDKFDLVFHLECRQMRKMIQNKDKITFEELLIKFHSPDLCKQEEKEAFRWCIKHNQERMLIILDGLDELAQWDDVFWDEDRKVITSITEKAEVPVILYNLLDSKLVQDARRIVTSRPIESIDTHMFSEVLVAIGFDQDAIDECSFSVCDYDRNIHKNIMEKLQVNTQLNTFCTIPLNCVLSCAILRQDLMKDKGGFSEETDINSLSQLSIRIILYIIHKDKVVKSHFTLSEDQRQSLRQLASLSAESLLGSTTKLIFDEQDLNKHGIEDLTDRTVQGFLELYREDGGMCLDADESVTASFLHLSIQEFMAAVHICLTWKDGDVRKIAKVDLKSRRLDNVQLYTAGLLGDSKLGHKFLKALTDGESEKDNVTQTSEFISIMSTDNETDKRFAIDDVEESALAHERPFFLSCCINCLLCRRTTVAKVKLSKLTKLQLIRCVHEGRLTSMIDDVADVVLSDMKIHDDFSLPKDISRMQYCLDLSSIEGGLLPYHLSSIGYFIQECHT